MFVFGKQSRDRLATCHPALAALATRSLEISPFDLVVVCGWRGKEDQDAAYASGKSRTRWPDSKHNNTLANGMPMSLAVDIAPYINGTIPWHDERAFCVMAGAVFAAARERGIEVRWGGDFKQNWKLAEPVWRDYPHFELVNP